MWLWISREVCSVVWKEDKRDAYPIKIRHFVVLQRIQLISTKLVKSLEVLVRKLREFDFLRFQVTYFVLLKIFFKSPLLLFRPNVLEWTQFSLLVKDLYINYHLRYNYKCLVLFLLYGGLLKQQVAYRSFL